MRQRKREMDALSGPYIVLGALVIAFLVSIARGSRLAGEPEAEEDVSIFDSNPVFDALRACKLEVFNASHDNLMQFFKRQDPTFEFRADVTIPFDWRMPEDEQIGQFVVVYWVTFDKVAYPEETIAVHPLAGGDIVLDGQNIVHRVMLDDDRISGLRGLFAMGIRGFDCEVRLKGDTLKVRMTCHPRQPIGQTPTVTEMTKAVAAAGKKLGKALGKSIPQLLLESIRKFTDPRLQIDALGRLLMEHANSGEARRAVTIARESGVASLKLAADLSGRPRHELEKTTPEELGVVDSIDRIYHGISGVEVPFRTFLLKRIFSLWGPGVLADPLISMSTKARVLEAVAEDATCAQALRETLFSLTLDQRNAMRQAIIRRNLAIPRGVLDELLPDVDLEALHAESVDIHGMQPVPGE